MSMRVNQVCGNLWAWLDIVEERLKSIKRCIEAQPEQAEKTLCENSMKPAASSTPRRNASNRLGPISMLGPSKS